MGGGGAGLGGDVGGTGLGGEGGTGLGGEGGGQGWEGMGRQGWEGMGGDRVGKVWEGVGGRGGRGKGAGDGRRGRSGSCACVHACVRACVRACVCEEYYIILKYISFKSLSLSPYRLDMMLDMILKTFHIHHSCLLYTVLLKKRKKQSPLAAFTSGAYFRHNGRR